MSPCVWCGREASPTSERGRCVACETEACERCDDERVLDGHDICETCERIEELQQAERLRDERAEWVERRVDEIRDRMAADRAARGAA